MQKEGMPWKKILSVGWGKNMDYTQNTLITCSLLHLGKSVSLG